MRVYITGIEGMLGGAIAHQHNITMKHEVSGCDVWNFASRYDNYDIRDYPSLLNAFNTFKPQRVYHCAAMLGVQNTEEHPQVCRQINEYGTENVVRAAVAAGVSELVFLSSSEVYGNGFDNFEPFSESSPLVGDNVYANSKKIGEQIVLDHRENMKIVVTRMFNCFGPNQVKQFLIPKMIDYCLKGRSMPIYGSFDNRRSYLLSTDAAQHIIDVANFAESGEIVNVAHPKSYTLEQVYRLVSDSVGRGGGMTLRMGRYDDREVRRDVPNRLANISKLSRLSRHSPRPLEYTIPFTVSKAATLRDDWTYVRGLL